MKELLRFHRPIANESLVEKHNYKDRQTEDITERKERLEMRREECCRNPPKRTTKGK